MNDQHTQAQNWNPQNSHSSVTSRNSTDRTVFWFKSQSRTVRRSGAKFRWAIYSLYNLVMEMAEQAKICKKKVGPTLTGLSIMAGRRGSDRWFCQ